MMLCTRPINALNSCQYLLSSWFAQQLTMLSQSLRRHFPWIEWTEKLFCVIRFVRFGTRSEAKQLWDHLFSSTQKVRVKEVHMLSGSVLLIWGATTRAMLQLSEAKQRQMRIVRAKTTEEQRSLVGILVPEEAVDLIKKAIVAEKAKETQPTASVGQKFDAPQEHVQMTPVEVRNMKN